MLIYNQVIVFHFACGDCGYGFFVEVMGNEKTKESHSRVIRGGSA
jgi:hypothetical protein